MTRLEFSGKRDLTFSGWIREKLPDSSFGFLVTDLDFIFYNYQTKKLMLLEVKTRNSLLKSWQKNIFDKLSEWITKGIDSEWEFLGFHIIKFENTFFNDGKCFFDETTITEDELIKKLSSV